MTNGGLEPRDQELIAAFIDGRMEEEERRAFMKRLDEEEALYEVFVESVRYRDQQAGGAATVIEHPSSRRRWSRLAAIAAVVAVAVATPMLLRNLGDEEIVELLAAGDRLDSSLGEGWYQQGWARTRGIAPAVEGGDAAFRVGVQAVDLEIALRLGRAEEAAILTHLLERDLSALDLSQPLQLCYEAIRELVEGGAPGDEVLALARSTDCVFDEYFPELAAAHRLGGWAEAGKLAAVSGNGELLVSRSFAREMGRLQEVTDWDPAVETRLEAIDTLLRTPTAELDLPALATAFTALIDEG